MINITFSHLGQSVPSQHAASHQIVNSALHLYQHTFNIAVQNLANAQSTARFLGDQPYQRHIPQFSSYKNAQGIALSKIETPIQDATSVAEEYHPGHPAADANGMVLATQINTATEIADARMAHTFITAFSQFQNIVHQQAKMAIQMMTRV